MNPKPKVVSITQRPPVEQPFPTQKEWDFLETYSLGADAQNAQVAATQKNALQENAQQDVVPREEVPQENAPQVKTQEGFFFKIRNFFGWK